MVRWTPSPTRVADGSDAGDVLLDVAMHLDLQVAISLIDQLLGIRRHFLRLLDRKDAQQGNAVPYLAAEQLIERHIQTPRQQIVQRAVDRRLGLVGAPQRAVNRHADRLDFIRIPVDDIRAQISEVGFQSGPGRAHMRGG